MKLHSRRVSAVFPGEGPQMGKFSFDGYRTQWPRVGGVLAMAIGGAAALGARKMSKPQLLSALNFGAFLVHRYEEHVGPWLVPRPVQRGRVQERPAPQLPAQQVHGFVRQHRVRLPVLHLADPVPPQEAARPEPGDLRDHAVRHAWGDRAQDCCRQVQPGFLASFFLHIPLGVAYIRALKAAEGLTRGDFAKSAAYTAAFVVIGVAGPNVVGKNKNTPYLRTREQTGPHDVEPA